MLYVSSSKNKQITHEFAYRAPNEKLSVVKNQNQENVTLDPFTDLNCVTGISCAFCQITCKKLLENHFKTIFNSVSKLCLLFLLADSQPSEFLSTHNITKHFGQSKEYSFR